MFSSFDKISKFKKTIEDLEPSMIRIPMNMNTVSIRESSGIYNFSVVVVNNDRDIFRNIHALEKRKPKTNSSYNRIDSIFDFGSYIVYEIFRDYYTLFHYDIRLNYRYRQNIRNKYNYNNINDIPTRSYRHYDLKRFTR